MKQKYRTFLNMVAITLIMLAAVLIMYTFSVQSSLDTVKKDIEANNLNRVQFVVNTLDQNIDRLNMLAITLETDNTIALLQSIDVMSAFEQVQLIQNVEARVKLQSLSEGWSNKISIYSILLNQWIVSSENQMQSPENDSPQSGWKIDPVSGAFYKYKTNSELIMRMEFPRGNLEELVENSHQGENEAVFYHPNQGSITRKNANPLTSLILDQVVTNLKPASGTETVSVNGSDYIVNYVYSQQLEWYLIDFMPLDKVLQPIKTSQIWFYSACVMLFMAGLTIIIVLFRKVQIPILVLLKGVRLLKHAEFSYRIKRQSGNEFDYLYGQFNDMAEQIEDLIEKVYKEKIIAREAVLKQLQAQINPHFLYNCLFFINNMTRLGNEEAVTAMTQNLAEYFRYTTRLNEPMTRLEKELGIVRNYLEIQCLRMERLSYHIELPDDLSSIPIPKLLVQPLVENSIIHGIEMKRDSGYIQVKVERTERGILLTVEDDGTGMTLDEINSLMVRLAEPPVDTIGCALWNITERLRIHDPVHSGIQLDQSPLGGMRVRIHWSLPTNDRELE
ncbi:MULTISPECIES: histidine kinase [unclassified Paenibacillus]|uniref:sensor histidine kinase n=1 Tax=unclassified Paenibacillus TaxID=185978 RepID=UPI0007BF7DCE|nr:MULTISPECIES: histidine kinase [unclassified Paenibacillus]SHN59098.1 two-component system, sensor histidine kinase YesM [Paenibacillus sp. ov031]